MNLMVESLKAISVFWPSCPMSLSSSGPSPAEALAAIIAIVGCATVSAVCDRETTIATIADCVDSHQIFNIHGAPKAAE